jgi:cell division protein FtsL
MPRHLTLRLSAVGHTLVSRNRRVSHTWELGKALVAALFLATAAILLTSLLWAWSNLKCIHLSYQISQAQETQKQFLDLNRKLRIELSNLTAISRLEKLAVENYGMGPPQTSQVLTLQ